QPECLKNQAKPSAKLAYYPKIVADFRKDSYAAKCVAASRPKPGLIRDAAMFLSGLTAGWEPANAK
ncbi:hypothetical protein NY486_01715, partial [Enterobacter hormaechei]|nr:hypothetical protein [Enterobacter hormaechei]